MTLEGKTLIKLFRKIETKLTILTVKEKNDLEKKKTLDISNNPKCLLIIKKGQKISRNERCEDTGKKFKQCCGSL